MLLYTCQEERAENNGTAYKITRLSSQIIIDQNLKKWNIFQITSWQILKVRRSLDRRIFHPVKLSEYSDNKKFEKKFEKSAWHIDRLVLIYTCKGKVFGRKSHLLGRQNATKNLPKKLKKVLDKIRWVCYYIIRERKGDKKMENRYPLYENANTGEITYSHREAVEWFRQGIDINLYRYNADGELVVVLSWTAWAKGGDKSHRQTSLLRNCQKILTIPPCEIIRKFRQCALAEIVRIFWF